MQMHDLICIDLREHTQGRSEHKLKVIASILNEEIYRHTISALSFIKRYLMKSTAAKTLADSQTYIKSLAEAAVACNQESRLISILNIFNNSSSLQSKEQDLMNAITVFEKEFSLQGSS